MLKRSVYKIPPVSAARSDPVARWIAFTGAPELTLRQDWKSQLEEDFSSGAVRVMWDQEGLVVAASLEDEDIVNPTPEQDRPDYTVGDVFEIFLWVACADSYFELHVTPANAHLALRFPVEGAERRDLDRFTIAPDCFTSLVKVDRIAASWTVAADVPWSLLGVEPAPGLELLASFGRYDYSKGRTRPVISSTSAHPERDFHRRQDWSSLVLGG